MDTVLINGCQRAFVLAINNTCDVTFGAGTWIRSSGNLAVGTQCTMSKPRALNASLSPLELKVIEIKTLPYLDITSKIMKFAFAAAVFAIFVATALANASNRMSPNIPTYQANIVVPIEDDLLVSAKLVSDAETKRVRAILPNVFGFFFDFLYESGYVYTFIGAFNTPIVCARVKPPIRDEQDFDIFAYARYEGPSVQNGNSVYMWSNIQWMGDALQDSVMTIDQKTGNYIELVTGYGQSPIVYSRFTRRLSPFAFEPQMSLDQCLDVPEKLSFHEVVAKVSTKQGRQELFEMAAPNFKFIVQ